MKDLIIGVLIAILVYLVCVFCYVSFDISTWTENGRIVCSVFMVGLPVVCYILKRGFEL